MVHRLLVPLALAAMLGLVPPAAAPPVAGASDRTTFRGCVLERADTSILLHTSADERVTIDTSWLRGASREATLAECVTVTALTVDGRLIAESVEAGDEPNEVNGVTNETTADRETRAKQRNERDEKSGKKDR